MSETCYGLLADLVAILHIAYAGTIVIALLLILSGALLGWSWGRNPTFRTIHFSMIAIVVAEAWAGITCPLTTWEQQLRVLAQQPFDGNSFLAKAIHQLLFFDAPWWVFTSCYTACGAMVAASVFFVPPDWSRFRISKANEV